VGHQGGRNELVSGCFLFYSQIPASHLLLDGSTTFSGRTPSKEKQNHQDGYGGCPTSITLACANLRQLQGKLTRIESVACGAIQNHLPPNPIPLQACPSLECLSLKRGLYLNLWVFGVRQCSLSRGLVAARAPFPSLII
jgi:hypothetical protein